ncbi:zf-TFIIB domain-containing protein [Candidatus Riflebacteria bacterium]
MSEIIFCPKCTSMPELKVVNMKEDLEVDSCPQCEGIWFDKGEISVKLNIAQDFPDFHEVLKKAKPTEYRCPRCQDRKLLEMQFIPEDPIMIDFCESCRGLWLDGGEMYSLDRIAKSPELKDVNFLKTVSQIKTDFSDLEDF